MSHDHAKELRVNGTDDWCDDCHGYSHMPWCPSYEQPSDKVVANDAEQAEFQARLREAMLSNPLVREIELPQPGNEQPASAAGSADHSGTEWCPRCGHKMLIEGDEPPTCSYCEQPAPAAPETGEEWRIDETGPRKGRVVIRDEKDRLSIYVLYGAFDQREPVSIAEAVERAEQIVKEHNSHHSLIAERERLRAFVQTFADKGCVLRHGTCLERGLPVPCIRCRAASLLSNDQKGSRSE